MSSKARKRDNDDDDGDGVFDDSDDDDDDDDSNDDEVEPAAKKRKKQSFIDDAAEESGDEKNEDEDEDEEDDNEYVKDGFVVDEEEEVKKKDDLEDSDDEDDDDEGGGDTARLKKVRKMRATDKLDDDDLALIKEARGDADSDEEMPEEEVVEKPRELVVAKTEAELRKGLFYDSGDEEQGKEQQKRKPARVERYDEDGMDDFIEDDIGDQDAIRLADRKSGAFDDDAREVNEAQLNEASEIFGTDYLEFMQDDDIVDEDEEELMGNKDKFRERGVGVSYGMDSDDEVISDDDDDDDLFGDEEDDGLDGESAQQKAEALRLKREKRKLAKAERRRDAQAKKSERRKAQLRRAFEPVQLVENFCTERDDDIRQTDIPERLYDWKIPFYGSEEDGMNEGEEEEARWIANRIPDVAAEIVTANEIEEKVKAIFKSITNALRYMHRDKLEPAFIKRYRKDYVTSKAVLANLNAVMDEDGEWDRVLSARAKVEALLGSITNSANADESVGADAQKLVKLQEELSDAQKKLDDTSKEENQVKAELNALGGHGDDEDDDDDELFGDDDDTAEEKKKQKERTISHLQTIQSLLEARADKVAQLQANVETVDAQNRALNDPGPVERIKRKMRREALWSSEDYTFYVSILSESRHVLDMNAFLHLVKEGNDSIRKKEMPLLSEKDGHDGRKRSRRFDRDYYRTCVADGLRDVCYRYLLAPNRVGIKLEETVRTGGFSYTRIMRGEDSTNALGWVPPVIPLVSPAEFAQDLIGSGELVLLETGDSTETKDPLRGCRYVAAMELAYEPRVRRYLRDIFRKHALVTTKPTKKGREEIDAFHDYYGLHLIRGKPVRDHFPLTESESVVQRTGRSPAEINEFEREMKKREKQSCLQFLNILKAESTGDVTVHVHLPLVECHDDWYKLDTDQVVERSNQDIQPLLNELRKVYMPADGDTREWEDERTNVLLFALTNFLLPQFESETRRDLRDASTKLGVIDAAQNLRDTAMEGPYRPAAILHTDNRFLLPTGNLSIVGICCANDGKDATYLASVTDRGESNDYLAIPSGMRVDSDKMREKVITFLIQTRPSAIVVGTSGAFESRMMQRKMAELTKQAVDRWKNREIQGEDEDDEAFDTRRNQFRQMQPTGYYDDQDDDDDDWQCNVDLIDDNVAQLFGRSIRGKKEFPDFAVNLKCAISVARYAKDPLSELTYAWSVASDAGMFGTEMLYLNIHPLQQLLPKTLLLREFERTLCDVVAEVGADLNATCSFDHLRGLLMFIPGLGPRKAANLKQTVTKMGGAVSRRRDLLEKRLLGPVVYNNAVAFLKIQNIDQLSDQYLHPLDETRLHPDVYLRNNWAVKIALDALEREDSKSKDQAAIKALRDVMDNSHKEVQRLYTATKAEWVSMYGPTFNTLHWDPRINVPEDQWGDKVDELDLALFAEIIENNEHGRWLSHLEMIKWEFRLPFADPRKPMEPLNGEKLFRLITGETDQSIRPGKELTGKVQRNGDFGSRVKLEGDIPAFIPLRNLSDDHVESADDYVSAGQVVTAVVTEVKKDHMTVDMSLKLDDFRKPPSSWPRPQFLPPLDGCFDMSAAARIEEENTKKREAHIEALQISLGIKAAGDFIGGNKRRRGRVVRRACTHPAFVNARNDEVDRRLKEGGAAVVGEALIRPSSKSSDSLAIHWVVKEGCIKVIEVIEEDKETDASIGSILKVKEETYESIDELLGRYIAPMNDYVEEVMHHRKFVNLNEDDVDDKLKAEKKANPKSVPYAVCWLEVHPGYASLRFVSTTNARNHLIGITPRGFVWCETVFSSLDQLINAFKKNPKGLQKSKRQTAPKASSSSRAAPPKGRWGSKPAPPTLPPPPVPPSQGWARPPPPPMPPSHPPQQPLQPVTVGGWGVPTTTPGWNAGSQPPQGPPPPPGLPPQPAYGQPVPPPPQRPPLPRHVPPPPQAPPPRPPPYGGHQPPAFNAPPAAQSQGRGRGRTLPAWMSKG